MVLARTAGSEAWGQEKENDEFQKPEKFCGAAKAREVKLRPSEEFYHDRNRGAKSFEKKSAMF